jgi:phenylalanyl-tRNA synthetase beta chain
MKISLKWLAEFFSEPQGKELLAQSSKIRAQLPFVGLEVASVHKMSEGLDQVVVGFVEQCEKHPDADRLRVCQLRFKSSDTTFSQIVCGAVNVAAGMKVAVALPGANLPGDFKISKSKIRGVESNGMICSESELGLAEKSEGIMVLPESAPLGSPIIQALGLNDEIWELELTPDRADCLSHLGASREVGRLLAAKPIIPQLESIETQSKNDVPLIPVEVQAPEACPSYVGLLLDGLTNSKSPDWLKRRLESLGHRSHDAIVDITNFVLHELGQPLHAFDADKIAGGKVIVRFAKEGEKLVTLDDIELKLTREDLVIADLEKPIALAGVMGGRLSAVGPTTKRIFLESALFDPLSIRKTAQRHKIHSDASHRYERGVDPAGIKRSAARAALLFKEICGLKRRGALVHVEHKKSALLESERALNLDLRAFQEIVGMEVHPDEVLEQFSKLGIKATAKSANVLRVEIPSHRLDLQREVDLIEEAARLVGYSKIPEDFPSLCQKVVNKTAPISERNDHIRNMLLVRGLSEMMPYSFISDEEARLVPQASCVALDNPLTAHWSKMRPCLAFGLLKIARDHVGAGQHRAQFFDLGSCFAVSPTTEPSASEKITGIQESLHAGFLLMGRAQNEYWAADKKAVDRKRSFDFFDAKGIVEDFASELSLFEGRWGGLQYLDLQSALGNAEMMKSCPWIPIGLLHPFRSALLVFPGKGGGNVVGYIGELHPEKRREALNLPKALELNAVVCELRIVPDLLKEMNQLRAPDAPNASQSFGKIKISRRVPIVERDLSLVFAAEVSAAEITRSISKAAGPELLELECLDLFPMEGGKKSLAYRLRLQTEETLSDEQIQAIVNRVNEELKKKYNAELRA